MFCRHSGENPGQVFAKGFLLTVPGDDDWIIIGNVGQAVRVLAMALSPCRGRSASGREKRTFFYCA